MYDLKRFHDAKEFYLTLVSLNLGAVCMGMTLGSSESSLAYFILPKELYNKISQDDQAMQMSITTGVGLGALLPVFFIDLYGRRTSFAVSSIVNAASWVILMLTHSRTAHIVRGFVAGIGGGIFQTSLALYVPEISSPKNRATVGVLVIFCSSIGMILTNTILIVINFKIFAGWMFVASITFLVTVVFCMIESPYFLYQRGKILQAKLSLKALRGARTVLEVDEDFDALKNFFVIERKTEEKPSPTPASRKTNRKSLALVVILLFVSQIVAEYAIDDYAMEVIEMKVPHYGKIIFSSLQVIAAGICLYIVEKVHRKFLLPFSIIGSTVCCMLLAIYRLVLQKECREADKYIALPVFLIAMYYAAYSLGLIPILPVLGGEIFSNRIKTIAVGCSMMIVYTIALGMQIIYSLLQLNVGACLSFVTFTFLGSLGLLIAVMALPETMGKSLYQIQGEIEDIAFIMS